MSKKISIIASYVFTIFLQTYAVSTPHKLTIMLCPDGDAQHTGRHIDGTFERSLTLQFTEELKKKLEKEHKDCSFISTRAAGDTIAPLQHAQFANRMNVDLYVSLHFFEETCTKPRIYLYQFSY